MPRLARLLSCLPLRLLFRLRLLERLLGQRLDADLEVFRSQGIEPTEQQILVVKSSVHFRAAFTPIAARIAEVDTPGLTTPHLERFDFRHIPRPIYPLDGDFAWQPPG